MGEWKNYTLSDLAEIHNQKRKPLNSGERAKRKGSFPYYGASGIVDYIDDYIFDGEYVLISEDGENLRSRQTPIAFKATGKFWVNNHAHIVKGNEKYINDLIVHYFANLDLSPYITGAVQPKLSKENLLSIPIELPELESEQRAIASILSSLDDKIDLLHRQNQTLEALAETLFRQWFMEEADEEWEMGKLGDLIEFAKGKKPINTSEHYTDGSVPQILIETFDTGKTLYADPQDMVIAKKDEILMVMDGGSSGRVELGFEGIVGSTIGLFKPKSEFSYPFFIFFFLKFNESFIKENTTGSAIPHADKALILDLDVQYPNLKTVSLFNQFAMQQLEKKHSNIYQIRTLTQLRDALLPKLMSGEVRVVYGN
ncbi:restriction endonuclease subunit S [bacterium]|nr:MAG: restriction endonuclease subunit S [bacterium]